MVNTAVRLVEAVENSRKRLDALDKERRGCVGGLSEIGKKEMRVVIVWLRVVVGSTWQSR